MRPNHDVDVERLRSDEQKAIAELRQAELDRDRARAAVSDAENSEVIRRFDAAFELAKSAPRGIAVRFARDVNLWLASDAAEPTLPPSGDPLSEQWPPSLQFCAADRAAVLRRNELLGKLNKAELEVRAAAERLRAVKLTIQREIGGSSVCA